MLHAKRKSVNYDKRWMNGLWLCEVVDDTKIRSYLPCVILVRTQSLIVDHSWIDRDGKRVRDRPRVYRVPAIQ